MNGKIQIAADVPTPEGLLRVYTFLTKVLGGTVTGQITVWNVTKAEPKAYFLRVTSVEFLTFNSALLHCTGIYGNPLNATGNIPATAQIHATGDPLAWINANESCFLGVNVQQGEESVVSPADSVEPVHISRGFVRVTIQ